MADLYGEWGSLDLSLPDYLKDVRDGVNTIAEYLLLTLSTANEILDVIKNFAVDIANPISLILATIQNLVKSLLNDLRNLGVYMFRDQVKTKGWFETFDDLEKKTFLGGYEGFESRVKSAMLNFQDPNNPVSLFSENTTLFGLYLYTSVPLDQVFKAIEAYNKLVELLTSKAPIKRNPLPVSMSYTYLDSNDKEISSPLGISRRGEPATKFRINLTFQEGLVKPDKAYFPISYKKEGDVIYEKKPVDSTTSEEKALIFKGRAKFIDEDLNKYIQDGSYTIENVSFYVSNTEPLLEVDNPTLLFGGVIQDLYVYYSPQNDPFGEAFGPIQVPLPKSATGLFDLLVKAYKHLIYLNNPRKSHYDQLSEPVKRSLKRHAPYIRGLNNTNPDDFKTNVQSIAENLAERYLPRLSKLPESMKEYLLEIGFKLEKDLEIFSVYPSADKIEGYKTFSSGLKKSSSPCIGRTTIVEIVNSTSTLEIKSYADWYLEPIRGVDRNSHSTILEFAEGEFNVSSSWEAFRFLPRVFPDFEDFLQEIDNFLESFNQGLKGIIKKIVEYIESIQARISEIQNFILRLTALLNTLLQRIDLPDFYVLLTESDGGSGAMSDFLTAENKPLDSERDLGFGVALIFGGVPNLLVDSFKFINSNVLNGGEQGDNAQSSPPQLPDGVDF